MPFIGIYDVFSASIAARHYDGIFLSGFGFAASYYGLPDNGFIAWSDMVAFVQRVRALLPSHHLLVDMDDGYGDPAIACHVTSLLEASGASAVVIEDQKRPRRCGHLDGKHLLDLDEFIEKLTGILAARRELFVIARTDAVQADDIFRRVDAFAKAGVDAVLVDGITDLDLAVQLHRIVDRPLVFNQIAGGKSPARSLEDLHAAGISMVIYSTPCLFSAQAAIEEAMLALKASGGLLQSQGKRPVSLETCLEFLKENQLKR